jgi:probable rRNA maturation factor
MNDGERSGIHSRGASGGSRGRGAAPPGSKKTLGVVLLNRQRRRAVRPARVRRVLRAAARDLGVTGELAVVLAGDRTLRTLNARYRGKDKPTDVLSFPGPGGEEGLGDVVISLETAARNARALGRTLPQELDVLALHGFLHVLGYDHETDDGTMDRLERRLRRKLLPGRPRTRTRP